MAEKGFEPMFCFSTSKTLYSIFSRHLGSTAPPLPAHSPGACRGHVGSSQWMHILTAPGSAVGLPTRCSRSWLSWHPPCPRHQHKQQSSTFLRPAQTAGGLLPCPPLLAHCYSPRACHGVGSSARGSLTRLQRREGAQSRGNFSPVPGALQVSRQRGAPAG